jgi:phage terminase small subunit
MMGRVSKPRPLPPRQKRFVAEYLIDLNATQAAIRSGYSAKTADVQGPRLLGNVGIASAIATGRGEKAEELGISRERVLKELALLSFSDHTHYRITDSGEITLAPHAPAEAHRAVSSIKRRVTTDTKGNVTREVEIRLWDKPGPLKLAGRHVGLFADRLELTGADGGAVKLQQVTRDEALAALRAVTGKKEE